MAGPFTHFMICDVAKSNDTALEDGLITILKKHSEFLLLGATSPDLPYLSFQTGFVNWANVMHYEYTNSIVISGHAELKKVYSFKNDADEAKFTWLMGYVSHLIADATIHPIVKAIVGPYKNNKKKHRTCEMTQDSLILFEYKGYDIIDAEYSEIIDFCDESPHFNAVMEFWERQLKHNYDYKDEDPHPKLWFETYNEAIDVAEGGYAARNLFRHVGGIKSLLYKSRDEIISNYQQDYQDYYNDINLPGKKKGNFKTDGFEKAVENVLAAWKSLYSRLSNAITVGDVVKDWNLDTGEDRCSANKEKTYWV